MRRIHLRRSRTKPAQDVPYPLTVRTLPRMATKGLFGVDGRPAEGASVRELFSPPARPEEEKQ
jgi:hypothetical protein